jgi:hypothetical protein
LDWILAVYHNQLISTPMANVQFNSDIIKVHFFR